MRPVSHYRYVRIRAALRIAVSTATILRGSEFPRTGAPPIVNPQENTTSVLVQLYLPGPIAGVTAAREVADEIFDETGISVHWAECVSWTPPSKRTGDCVGDAEDVVIEMRLETDTPDEYKPGVLGETMPFSANPIPMRIFVTRILGMRGGSPLARRILGHVLAHEIGHVLLESDWHSDHGLMARRWNAHELMEMADGVLTFSHSEIGMMRRSLATRFTRHRGGKVPTEGFN